MAASSRCSSGHSGARPSSLQASRAPLERGERAPTAPTPSTVDPKNLRHYTAQAPRVPPAGRPGFPALHGPHYKHFPGRQKILRGDPQPIRAHVTALRKWLQVKRPYREGRPAPAVGMARLLTGGRVPGAMERTNLVAIGERPVPGSKQSLADTDGPCLPGRNPPVPLSGTTSKPHLTWFPACLKPIATHMSARTDVLRLAWRITPIEVASSSPGLMSRPWAHKTR